MLDARRVDLLRINLSHTRIEDLRAAIDLIRACSDVPISLDTEGAQVRCGSSSIVREIVARPGWSAGNALVVIITGTGKRTAEAFDGTFAPVLHVTYRTA